MTRTTVPYHEPYVPAYRRVPGVQPLGQEVYSGNGNSGWDGTWKGVPQASGTYNYQIRISFPDGYTESYKGDVNLVR